MSTPELVFSQAPATSGVLVFGETDEAGGDSLATISGAFQPLTVVARVAPDKQVSVTGVFAPLVVEVSVADIKTAAITGVFAPLVAMVEAQYSSNTARPTVGKANAAWQLAQASEKPLNMPHQEGSSKPAGWDAFWQKTIGTATSVEQPLRDTAVRLRNPTDGVFQQGTPAGRSLYTFSQDGTRAKITLGSLFENGTPAGDDTLFRHQDGDRLKRAWLESLYQEASPAQFDMWSGMQKATALDKWWAAWHQDGVPPPAGITLLPGVVIPPLNTCYMPDGNLVFSSVPTPFGNLVFICDNYATPPGETVVVPVRRVYIVLNSVSLFRVSDNAPVPTLDMSLSLDVDSWAWGFSATLPAVAQALVEPTGSTLTELKAMVNGTEFRVIAESVSRDRTFGQTTIKVSGRGRIAILDAPYAAAQNFTNTIDRTAQQLMGDVLMLNGVSLGWTVNWGLEDWVVPAGVFNHQGTHISALNAIAGAAGGFLLPHTSTKSFTVKHRYPLAPWDWATATPDFAIPADLATQEGIEWVDKALYNRVYVSGESQGVLGNIKREGTAGDLVAQMVTDPLITEGAAARQRGIAILSNTGLMANVTLRLPVLSETGILLPGHMVDYVDGLTTRRGLVRSTQVSVGGEANVWQSLGIETHV